MFEIELDCTQELLLANIKINYQCQYRHQLSTKTYYQPLNHWLSTEPYYKIYYYQAYYYQLSLACYYQLYQTYLQNDFFDFNLREVCTVQCFIQLVLQRTKLHGRGMPQRGMQKHACRVAKREKLQET